MEKTLIYQLQKRLDTNKKLAIEFNNDADRDFSAGKIVGEIACRRLARECEGQVAAYTKSIELINKYVGIRE